MNNSSETLTFTVPLSFEAHSLAQKYSKHHNQLEKAKQVYLNTLAVYAVEHYFRCMGFETDWENNDSRNPLVQKFMDVADLDVKDLGKFECRPVLPDAEVLKVPSEAWDERIGYVAVQLTQSLKQATLLGFVPQLEVDRGIIPLSQLYSLEVFPDYLSQKRQQLLQTSELPKIVNLENWLDNIFEAGWQAVEEFLTHQTSSMTFGFRKIASARVDFDTNSIKRLIEQLYASQRDANHSRKISLAEVEPSVALSQLIQSTQDEEIRWRAIELLWQIKPNHPVTGVRRIMDLGMQLGGYPVALMVAVLPKLDGRRAILLRVYPMGGHSFLPVGLKLIGLDEAGHTFSQVQARSEDNYIQLKFSADIGDRFSVRFTLGDASVLEFFVV
ncbi:DUF1822 family protein [Scytonema sp. UIC 10036]|uniref:DUF1822 family protein n=1 Tax=Scytonema sp. UIC 10036 TaxID=2304196 RepID=UPI0012DA9B4B|nr:DUF1822 family protein [Scytonema sp. UIC 10036]MUG91049.1 DUF1822 family protein [Scytonema sp. UIC 10036]